MAKFVLNRKGKGTAAENELIHKFWESDSWVCVRVAGSGSNKYPSPDLLASRGDKKIVMEVKVVNDVKKYFTGQEIRDLNYFAQKFGAESWVGIRFEGNQWFFIPASELEITKSENYVITLIDMKRKGFSFDEMIK
jgi:Holliday junction resolvase